MSKKKVNMSSTLNLKTDWKATLLVVDFPPRMLFSIQKIPFLWLANTGLKPPFFKISRLKLQKVLKTCWPNETESLLGQLSVKIILLGLPHIVNAAPEAWPNPRPSSYQRELFFAERLTSCQT